METANGAENLEIPLKADHIVRLAMRNMGKSQVQPLIYDVAISTYRYGSTQKYTDQHTDNETESGKGVHRAKFRLILILVGEFFSEFLAGGWKNFLLTRGNRLEK